MVDAFLNLSRKRGFYLLCFLFLVSPNFSSAATRSQPGDVDSASPGSLHLARRASLAVNCLTRGVDADRGYRCHSRLLFGRQNPTVMWEIQVYPTGILPVMQLRALPLIRMMTGSQEHLQLENAMLQSLLNRIDESGHLRYPAGDSLIPEGSSYPNASGFFVLALFNRYEYDKNPQWLKLAEKLLAGLRQSLIRKKDYGYFPPECGFDLSGNWTSAPRVADKLLTKPHVDYDAPHEPKSNQMGYKGSVKYEQVGPLLAFLKAYEVLDDSTYLETATQIARFCVQDKYWEGQVGQWAGYVHGELTVLQALLEFALIVRDRSLAEAVKNGYELARTRGVAEIGWFPYWSPAGVIGYPDTLTLWSEPCAVAAATMLAIRLSETGFGDHWDDVDRYVRNQLAEQQFTDLFRMKAVCAKAAAPIELDKQSTVPQGGKPLLERFVGGFGGGDPDSAGIVYMDKNAVIDACCSANGALTLQRVWRAITTFDGETATVNLLLDRTSDWLDIKCGLPYEGKVEVTNKTGRRLRIRMPGWVDRSQTQATRSGRRIEAKTEGTYLVVEELDSGTVIELTFDVPTYTNPFSLAGKHFEITMKGSTVVKMQPERNDPYIYKLYQDRQTN